MDFFSAIFNKIRALKLACPVRRYSAQGVPMKEQVVGEAVAAVVAGQAQVLVDQMGSVFDKAQAELPTGGMTQADVDAAVAAAIAPLQGELDALKGKIAQILALLQG